MCSQDINIKKKKKIHEEDVSSKVISKGKLLYVKEMKAIRSALLKSVITGR